MQVKKTLYYNDDTITHREAHIIPCGRVTGSDDLLQLDDGNERRVFTVPPLFQVSRFTTNK